MTFSRSIAESEEGTVEKGTKSDRTYSVTLGPDTKEMLAAHAGRSRRNAPTAVGVPFGQSSFVFSDDAVSHWSLAWPSHAWQRYSTRAGIARVRLHDLRHTAASQMLMAGVANLGRGGASRLHRRPTSCAPIVTSFPDRITRRLS